MAVREESQLLVRVLRAVSGLSQEAMGAAASIDRTTISRYETGEMVPTRKHLGRLAAAADLSLPLVEAVLMPVVHLIATPAAATLHRIPPPSEDIMTTIKSQAAATLGSGYATLTAALAAGDEPLPFTPPRPQDRDAVPKLWASLASSPPAQWRDLIAHSPAFHTWAFCERLCDESERLAAADPDQALNLAHLGLLAAQHAPGCTAWGASLEGYAWAFVANALRAKGDLPAARAAFNVTRTLRLNASPSPYPGLLAESRVQDMAASLAQTGPARSDGGTRSKPTTGCR